MPTAPIKLVALDLDGTLLHNDKTISAANRKAINDAVGHGIKVVLASGRMHSATARYAIDLGLAQDSFVISYNGAMVRTIAGKTYFHHPLNADAASYVTQFCIAKGYHLNYYLDDILYTQKLDYWSDWYEKRTGCPSVAADLRQFDGREPTKLIIVDDKDAVDHLLPDMQKHFDGNVIVMKTDDEYLEFMHPVATKGNALAKVALELGIECEECLAMGDNYNDLSMLKWAGYGFVMESGREDVLSEIPNHAPPADEDGVAVVLERFMS